MSVTRPRARDRLRAGTYVASVLASAFLLFLLQPMLGRLLLPVYGGSPAVWNTCMVFFQVLLLAGYAYAHGSLRWLGLRRQAMLHVAVLLASLALLPSAAAIAQREGSSPVLAILATLAAIAGVPFFVLSTNSSLTQRWFSVGSFSTSADPFWLYAASNAGSLAALLAYPAIVEPLFGLRSQLRFWAAGYVGFVALSIASIALSRRGLTEARVEPVAIDPSLAPSEVTWRRRWGWVARSAVASSLLLGVTMQITSDVIAAPLLWVVPLAIYLATFIVAFSPSRRTPRRAVAFAARIGIALCLVLVIVPTMFPLWLAFLAPLATLYAGGLLCHGDIADDRPHASDLTDFYLWIAVGGVLGGIANSIVAPVVFSSLAEYPITLVCLAMLLGDPRGDRPPVVARLRRVATRPAAVAMTAAIVVAAAGVMLTRSAHAAGTPDNGLLRWQFMPVAVLLCGVLFAGNGGTFAVAAALAAAFMVAGLHFVDPIIDQGRSFFGVSRVTENGRERVMLHGVTVHGSQRLDPAWRDVPTSYYYPKGPLGWAVANLPPGATVGVIGLGAGSLAPLAGPSQRLTYYEIDPLVERMARRDFTYLADARARVTVVIGDGRRMLATAPDDHFNLLIVDAFTSDAIPTHLLTDEALRLYMRKLAPDGLLIVHISNRYADLSRVFRGWRRATGQRVAIDQYVPTPDEQRAGVRATVAVAMARSPAALAWLAQTKQWFWLDDDGPSVHWTDDHIALISVLDRNMLRP